MLFMKVDRRKFLIQFAAISAAGALGISYANNGPKNSSKSEAKNSVLIRSDIEKSIKANLGSGFDLNQYVYENGAVHANVNHFNNEYLISSDDLKSWNILESSIGKNHTFVADFDSKLAAIFNQYA